MIVQTTPVRMENGNKVVAVVSKVTGGWLFRRTRGVDIQITVKRPKERVARGVTAK